MLVLRCPKCSNTMLYQGRTADIMKKRKRCVYCGFCMGIRKSVVKKSVGTR